MERICEGAIVDRSMAVAYEWRDKATAAISTLPQTAEREALEAIANFVTQRDF